jgi:hypothetical protein
VSDSTGYFAQNAGPGGMLAKLLDTSRYGEVAAYFWRTFTQAPSQAYGGLLIAAALLGILARPAWRSRAQSSLALAPLACVLLAVLGFTAIFVMTPIDLGEHLRTTAYRFLKQVYPALFFAFFTLIATLEPAAAAEERPA